MRLNPFRKKSLTPPSGVEKWGNSYFYPYKLTSNLYDKKTFEAFNKVPEVNAVLNYRANARKNVIIRAVNKTTSKDSTAPGALKAIKLLNNPNFFQDGKEFIRQSSLWHDIDGNEYLFFQKAVGFQPTNAKQLFTLPPENIKITLENEGPFFFLDPANISIKYTIKIGGQEIPLPSDDIVHLNDNRVNVSENNDNLLKGESKLKALSGPINNIIAAYSARNKFLVSRGALGILSNSSKDGTGGTAPLDDTEKEKLQKEYSKYGLQPDQWGIVITNMSLTWQQMSVDIEKLKVFEEVEADFNKILDAFGVPKDLFASMQRPSFQNQKHSEKRFYENTVIPEFNEWIGGINGYFNTEKESWKLIGDFTHLPIFQDNIKERSSSLQTLVNALSGALADGAITIEQYQAELAKFGI